MSERLPWNTATSLDNVYAGLLVHLYRLAGGDDSICPAATDSLHAFPCDNLLLAALPCGVVFLRRWFRVAMPLLLLQKDGEPSLRCPKTKADTQTARDNFVLAASISAGRSLVSHFAIELRWPSLDVRAVAMLDDLLEISEALAPWPMCALPVTVAA